MHDKNLGQRSHQLSRSPRFEAPVKRTRRCGADESYGGFEHDAPRTGASSPLYIFRKVEKGNVMSPPLGSFPEPLGTITSSAVDGVDDVAEILRIHVLPMTTTSDRARAVQDLV